MKQTTTTTKKSPLLAARRILLGKNVDPSLSPEKIAEIVELHDEAAAAGDDKVREVCRNALMDRRRKGVEWDVTDEDGDLYDDMEDGVSVAVLMDIRDELGEIKEAIRGLGKGKR